MNKAKMATIENQGCQLAYTVEGTGSPVLLIQGVGLHGSGWQPQVAGLASQYSCLSFDNRGIGNSHPLGKSLSVEQMAADAQALINAQGWDSAHVVGHSLGGLIALELALKARPQVRSLSLLCTFAKGRDAISFSPGMIWIGLRSRVGTKRMRRQAFLKLVMPPTFLAQTNGDLLAEKLKPIFGHDLADQPPVVMKQLAAMSKHDLTPHLGELSGLPTLIVAAQHDPIAPPRVGRAMAAKIPNSRYIEIPDASHGVTIQCADHINALLLEHFTQVDQAK